MEQDFTTCCGDTKLRNKWNFLSLDSLWPAVTIKYALRQAMGSRLLEWLYFSNSKGFLGFDIDFVFVISKIWHTTSSSYQDNAWGLIALNPCPLALQTRASNMASLRVSTFWVKPALGPSSCKWLSTWLTSQVLVHLGTGGLSLKAPRITSFTKECFPTEVPSTLQWKCDIAVRYPASVLNETNSCCSAKKLATSSTEHEKGSTCCPLHPRVNLRQPES